MTNNSFFTENINRKGFNLDRGNGYWVSQNEDGTLLVSNNGIEPYGNAGSLIMSLGGIEKTLAACDTEDITLGDWYEELKRKAHIWRYGEEPTNEERKHRLDFYHYLIATGYQIAHTDENGKFIPSGRIFGEPHKPTNSNEGFRFDSQYRDFRFDSVYGWQFHSKYNGWLHTDEFNSRIIEIRMQLGLPKYQPKAEDTDRYETLYQQVYTRLHREEIRKQEITDAYDAIKDLRPVPATIENITTILQYYKMQGYVGELLPMTIGYSCNDYDCDGKHAVAIKLDSPIIYNEEGDMNNRFVCGAPRGHLTKYTRI